MAMSNTKGALPKQSVRSQLQPVHGELRRISDGPNGRAVGVIEIPIFSDPDGKGLDDAQRLRVVTDLSGVMSEEQLAFARAYLNGEDMDGAGVPESDAGSGFPVGIIGKSDEGDRRIDVCIDTAGLADKITEMRNEQMVKQGRVPLTRYQRGVLQATTDRLAGDAAFSASKIEDLLRTSSAARYMLSAAGKPDIEPPVPEDVKLAAQAISNALQDTAKRFPRPGSPSRDFHSSSRTYYEMLDEQSGKLGLTDGAKKIAMACTVGFVRDGEPGDLSAIKPSIYYNMPVDGRQLQVSQEALRRDDPSEVYGSDVIDNARTIRNEGRAGSNTPVFDRMHKEAALSMPLTGQNDRFRDTEAVIMDYTPVVHDLGKCTIDTVDAFYKSLAQTFVKAAEKAGQVPDGLAVDEHGNLSVANIDVLASDTGHEDVLKFGHQMNRYIGMHVVTVEDMPVKNGRFNGTLAGTATWLDFESRANGTRGREFFMYDMVDDDLFGYENDGPDPQREPEPEPVDDDDKKDEKPPLSAYERLRRMVRDQDGQPDDGKDGPEL